MERMVLRLVVPVVMAHRRKNMNMAQNLTAEHEQAPEATALDAGREYVGRIRDTGQNLAGSVYQSGHRKAEEAAFYAELGYEEARDWARSHPSQALGIAAGIGLLLGIVVARR